MGSVVESSQTANVIQSTCPQHATGLDQVSVASIGHAVKQIVSHSNQLKESVAGLEDLGNSVNELVDQYRV
ncbi:MAG: hypothetical protein HY914_18190 [Desulfomonile tiedjei]|nr:hypothetical protein [Desulfomonile tiedjei]